MEIKIICNNQCKITRFYNIRSKLKIPLNLLSKYSTNSSSTKSTSSSAVKFSLWISISSMLSIAFASLLSVTNFLNIEKIYKHSSLNWIRTVLRQLVYPSYSSKDAPRSSFSNALRFISFRQLLMSLRAHLRTVVLKKKSQNTCVCELFHEKKNSKCYHFD